MHRSKSRQGRDSVSADRELEPRSDSGVSNDKRIVPFKNDSFSIIWVLKNLKKSEFCSFRTSESKAALKRAEDLDRSARTACAARELRSKQRERKIINSNLPALFAD